MQRMCTFVLLGIVWAQQLWMERSSTAFAGKQIQNVQFNLTFTQFNCHVIMDELGSYARKIADTAQRLHPYISINLCNQSLNHKKAFRKGILMGFRTNLFIYIIQSHHQHNHATVDTQHPHQHKHKHLTLLYYIV